MNILAIIPARYASTRFPGKPLALINGRPMIEWVWEGVKQIDCISNAVVATDDERIAETVRGFGGEVMMTSDSHRSGTDRCGEVIGRWKGETPDVVINIQGDEPNVNAEQIEAVAQCFDDKAVQIATLKKAILREEDLFSPNVVKVVTDLQGNALLFSRHPLPYVRGKEQSEWMNAQQYFKHIGIYAFRKEVLEKVVRLPQSQLEKSESLEQLRWIENGYRIRVAETTVENIGVDTPEDLARLNESLIK